MRRKKADGDESDGELFARSRKGDEEAFVNLYRRHQGPVFRFALHMSGSREVAEEVTQEVFLSLLAQANRYMPEQGALQAWLIGMARNLVRTQLRRSGIEIGEELLDDRARDSGDVVDALTKEQELELLRTAILRLPENYREVLVLCELEEWSYEQAAAQLGCAVGTVRSRLHRARLLLGVRMRKPEGCSV